MSCLFYALRLFATTRVLTCITISSSGKGQALDSDSKSESGPHLSKLEEVHVTEHRPNPSESLVHAKSEYKSEHTQRNDSNLDLSPYE